MREILLGLGANCPGAWGTPVDTLRHAVRELARKRLHPSALSPLYITPPLGGPAQPPYVNAVVRVRTDLPLGEVLRAVKRLERAAGRRSSGRWGPRPLDIDILDDRSACVGWRRRRDHRDRAHGRRLSPNSAARMTRPTVLSVPHPRLHVRAFVLLPLRDIAPHWRHPVLGRSVFALLTRLSSQTRAIQRADAVWAEQSRNRRATEQRLPGRPLEAQPERVTSIRRRDRGLDSP